VMIHYSRGYNDENGQYVAKEYAYENFENITFNETLYEQVKTALYELLATKV